MLKSLNPYVDVFSTSLRVAAFISEIHIRLFINTPHLMSLLSHLSSTDAYHTFNFIVVLLYYKLSLVLYNFLPCVAVFSEYYPVLVF